MFVGYLRFSEDFFLHRVIFSFRFRLFGDQKYNLTRSLFLLLNDYQLLGTKIKNKD